MAYAIPTSSNNSLNHIEWMWQSNPDPWSTTEPTEWDHYSDVKNLIIEEAFSNKQSKALLDGYYIDFRNNRQISNTNSDKQRPVKRMMRNRKDKNLREERFMDLPVASRGSLGGQYDWISPFVIEIRRNLNLKPEELPSKKPDLIPMLVEEAARGIIEEGKYIGKERQAEKLAEILREQKNKGIKEVWQQCAYIYSLESFLYKTLNTTMRLVGNKDHEQEWKSKIRTLRPFCLLLWNDPFKTKLKTKKTLYRGANLKSEQIVNYKEMAKQRNEYRSFEAFTSCSRNREKTEELGNTLFIMEVESAFVVDISEMSEYPNEEEELVTPDVRFCVKNVEFDRKTNKHLIYLQLQQWKSGK
ncbi:unnamed protein product [Rotaria sp. Silwood2]|nr:unnamed protein product [Rotaria sp. Silwood2]CAF3078329.1 unnamed protein product [Rotaria sp. Silwood2]CAF3404800.1 unnamed protein product [Rotaria sp. Silwood2]CAF4336770.1 unnamed protein product [Rotaria sp. Silwood2]CAF4440729.1 unnamed protein product [Rotaria sp. Silwood2]